MSVLLVVDRAEGGAGIWAMVWTTEEADPRLLESRHFRGEAALKVWLAGIAIKYGRGNIQVNWSDALKADERLTVLLEESVGGDIARG